MPARNPSKRPHERTVDFEKSLRFWPQALFFHKTALMFGALHHGILRNHFPVPFSAQFRRALLCFEIDIVDPEALAVSIRPFEVVEQAP
jgi:hypothetical protein